MEDITKRSRLDVPQCLRREDAPPTGQLQRVEADLPAGARHPLPVARLPAHLLHGLLRPAEGRPAHHVPRAQLHPHDPVSVRAEGLRHSLRQRDAAQHRPGSHVDDDVVDERGATRRTETAKPRFGGASSAGGRSFCPGEANIIIKGTCNPKSKNCLNH